MVKASSPYDGRFTNMTPCRRCGHHKYKHMHYRKGTDCSEPLCACKVFLGRTVRQWLVDLVSV